MNNMNFKPDAPAKQKREAFDPLAELSALRLDGAMPEAWRSLAQSTVDQTREAYERAKATLDGTLDAMEKSYDAASHAAAALNRKIADIAERNIDSGFDLARSLATAKNLAEVLELQGAYWRKQFDTLLAQAEEVRSLSSHAASEVTTPIAREATKQTQTAQAQAKTVAVETAGAIKRQTAKLAEELRRAS